MNSNDKDNTDSKMFKFGPWDIRSAEIFYVSKLSFGLVNLKPIVPGHVLIIPKRVVSRFNQLSQSEVQDLFLSAQEISQVIETHYQGQSLTMTIQDGPMAGQTVPHVHLHLIPRRKGDWADNDDIYSELDWNERNIPQVLKQRKELLSKQQQQQQSEQKDDINSSCSPSGTGPRVDNEERPPRTLHEMAVEAAELRKYFTQFEDIWTNDQE